jgi:hypothetical protein
MERLVKLRRFSGEALLLLAMALTASWLMK